MVSKKGFFESLFDLSFDHSIAVRIVGLLYVIALVLTAFGCLTVIGAAGRAGGVTGALASLILVPIIWLVYAIFIRVGLEALVASIKTADNTRQMLELLRQQSPGNQQPPYGQPPHNPPNPYRQ